MTVGRESSAFQLSSSATPRMTVEALRTSPGKGVGVRASAESRMVDVIRNVWIPRRDMCAPVTLALSWATIVLVKVRFV